MKRLAYSVLLFPMLCYSNPRVSLIKPQLDDAKLIMSMDLTLYRDTQYTDPSLQYYTPDYTIGIQATNIRLSGVSMQNYESDTYINAARSFKFAKKYSIEFGGMAGTNMNSNLQQLHAYAYTDLGYAISENLGITAGSYYVNDVLATKHQPFNAHVGIKYKFSDFVTTGDFYSGSNNVSGAIFNLFYKLTPTIRPFAGVSVPTTNSGNEFAGTVGLSIKLN